jgi:N-acyl-D-aspartate/D-glutamate deacylase
VHDLVIRDGRLVDGSGAALRPADVAVDGDRITEVGCVGGRGRREIAADGLLVTPGFVDIHTHYDGQASRTGDSLEVCRDSTHEGRPLLARRMLIEERRLPIAKERGELCP